MKQVLQDLKSGSILVTETPDPSPASGRLLVRVQASLLSAGTESAQVARARQSLLEKVREKPELIRKGLEEFRERGLAGVREKLASKFEGFGELGYSCAGTVIHCGTEDASLAPGTLVACAAVPIQSGEFILNGKFGTTLGATFTVFPSNVAADPGQAIPPGTPNYRAMSITVPDQFAVGGAIQVGDIIDIMYTLTFDPNKYFVPQPGIVSGSAQDRRTVDFSTKIILEKVPVIARTLAVYTIRTDATTAERLAYLQAAGAQIQMLLRAPADDRAVRTEGATFEPVQQTFGFRVPQRITP